MGIYAEKKEGEFLQVEPGTYVARCYSMIEFGTVETEYLGEKKKSHQVNISWELPTELAVFHEDRGPEPFVVSKTYTLSMHENAKLREHLESWRGKAYTDAEAKKVDISKLIGKPCQLTLVQEASKKDVKKKFINVKGISGLMKGYECPPQINPSRMLSFEDWNEDVFNTLPDWMQSKIKSSDEYKALQEPSAVQTNDDISDLPF